MHVNLWNIQWFCRHIRQAMGEVEQWTVSKFRSALSVAQGIVSKEWEVPGE